MGPQPLSAFSDFLDQLSLPIAFSGMELTCVVGLIVLATVGGIYRGFVSKVIFGLFLYFSIFGLILFWESIWCICGFDYLILFWGVMIHFHKTIFSILMWSFRLITNIT